MGVRVADGSAEQIEEELAHDVLGGRIVPGQRLPAYRALAERFDVTLPTVQRALAGLEARGLVTVRRGSGTEARDPWSSGDLSMLATWLVANRDRGAAVVEVVSELLELRRVEAAWLLVRLRRRPALLARLQEAVPDGGLAPRDFARADVAFVRALLEAAGERVRRLVFAAFEQVLSAEPRLVEAMYGEPRRNELAWQWLAAAAVVLDDDMAFEYAARQLMNAVDAHTLARLQTLVTVSEEEL